MKKPSVSILMGSYNPRDPIVLRQAIDSIIAQTWTDWELLICDDGSVEPYAGYIRNLAALDTRIRCMRSDENRGLAHALNMCLCHSRGEWIARMDDDDISEPDRLEKQVQFLSKNKAFAWVGTQALLFDKNHVWGIAARPAQPSADDYLKFSPVIHPSVMFRRSVLEQAGGYLVSTVTVRCEDYELFMRLTAAGHHGYNLQDILFRYREDPVILHKRSFRNCFFEAVIRFNGFRSLNLLCAKNIPYVVKPLAVYILARFPRLAQRIRISRVSSIQPLNNPVEED